jgi:hypothetical protein
MIYLKDFNVLFPIFKLKICLHDLLANAFGVLGSGIGGITSLQVLNLIVYCFYSAQFLHIQSSLSLAIFSSCLLSNFIFY